MMTRLPPGFQSGLRFAAKAGTQQCAANASFVHQCRKCLGHTHGADACQADIPTLQNSKGKSKGNGKGKGKGKRYFG